MKSTWMRLSTAAVFSGTAILGLWLLFPHARPCLKSTMDAKWETVVSSGGCMQGHDDWLPAEGAGPWEGWSVSSCWKRITTGDPGEVIPFLTAKLPSRRETGVHVDPFDFAIEGELAVYALQHTTRKNWYEYDGGNAKLDAAVKVRRTREQKLPAEHLDYPNDQLLLQDVLTDGQAIDALARFFSIQRT